jgi:SpoVK/Ycf46/Vps4 family AAA+-type ATPase
LLEYFQGILILTTNRIGVFDPAFKSRIHLAIKYHALSPKSRRDLWKVFITSASSDITPEWLNNEVLDRFAAERINGRQIKNTVRTAQALAVSENCPLGVKHIDMSLTAMSMFETDFAEDATEFEDRDIPEFRSKRRREY